jgi:hypothetical protein
VRHRRRVHDFPDAVLLEHADPEVGKSPMA